MKRWNTYFIGKKNGLASKENITIQKPFGYKKAVNHTKQATHPLNLDSLGDTSLLKETMRTDMT